jgi:predicted ATPase
MASNPAQERSAVRPATTGLIGRNRETRLAEDLFRRSRLVTLVGPGGVGKSVLARHLASRLGPEYPDGVHVVGLETVEGDPDLADAVAKAVGTRNLTDQSATDLVCDFLRHKRALVLLDNCEHLQQACAELVDQLLRAAPGVVVLATSRHVLGMSGEAVLQVPPLSVLEPDERPAGTAGRSESVLLFVARGAQARPDFTLDRANAGDVMAVCRRLEGIPLAIELAAARMRTMSPAELLDALDGCLGASWPADQGLHPRHRTLYASIGWSFDLCSPGEQLLWMRLSRFAGSFDLDSAEAVCAAPDLPRADVLDLLTGLIDKSVVTRADGSGGPRYRMLDMIRQYGRERAEHQPATADTDLRRRLRDHYLALAEQAQEHWLDRDEEAWLSRLREEHPNLRVALEFCATEPGESEAGLTIVSSLWWHWICGGSLGEGSRWLERLLALPGEPDSVRATAELVASWLAILQGRGEESLESLAAAEAAAARLGNTLLHARVAHCRGMYALTRGDSLQAARFLDDGLAAYRRCGDGAGEILALYHLATARALMRDPHAAVLGQECLARCQERGAVLFGSYARSVIGFSLLLRGTELDRAAALLQDGLRVRWPMNDRWGTALSLELLAWSAAALGDCERGARLLGAADLAWRSMSTAQDRLPHLATERRRATDLLRRGLGEEGFAAAEAAGAGLSSTEAVEYALRPRPAPAPEPRG